MGKFVKEIQLSVEEFYRTVKSLNMKKIGENNKTDFYTYISPKNQQKVFVKVRYGLDFDYTPTVNIKMNFLGDIINVKEEIKKPELTTEELFEFMSDFDESPKYAIHRREDFILENGVKLYHYQDDLYKDKDNDDLLYKALYDESKKIKSFQEIPKIED